MALIKSSFVLLSLPGNPFHTSKADLPSAPSLPAVPTSPLSPLGPAAPATPASPFSPFSPCGPAAPSAPFAPVMALIKSSSVLLPLPGMSFHTSKADLPLGPTSPCIP